MQMSKLNAMGEVADKTRPAPQNPIGQNCERQVGVLYGHNGGGKVYNYLGGKNLRTGDFVTPEVTHPKSGKTYKTLARVVTTRDSLGEPAANTAGQLSGRGVLMKKIGQTDQRSLPGFKAKQEQNPGYTVGQWEQEAGQKYAGSVMKRLGPMGDTQT